MAQNSMAVRAEHQARFAALIEQNRRSMFRVARAILSCDADAEDAVSQATLNAWQAFGRLRDDRAATSWLLKITVNCARDQFRKGARVTYVEDLAPYAGEAEAPLISDLWEAVCRLPEDSRALVTLYYYNGLSIDEVAHVLGIRTGTAKSRLARARGKLKNMLEEDAP